MARIYDVIRGLSYVTGWIGVTALLLASLGLVIGIVRILSRSR